MMQTLKAIKSLWTGLLATVSPQRFADCGVKVGIAPDPLEEAEKALSFVIQRENDTNAKLDAAADALRRIECLTHEVPTTISEMVHKIAQDAWRATQA